MRQRELLGETIDFITPSEKKIKGILFHENYSESISIVAAILVAGLIIHWVLFDVFFTLLFGVILFILALSSELVLRKLYGFTGQDAAKYYAIQLYNEPSKKALNQLNSWNKNPFDLSTEYYYPRIGNLVEEASNKDNPPEYVHKRMPDELRLIEKREHDSYQTLVDINLEELNLDPYYKDLIREANYCYKFGSYTSVSVLLRKISEQLLVDILTAKGLYSELSSEYGFEELATVFIDDVVSKEFPEDMKEDMSESLNVWIRKKGNKGAHKNEEFSKKEIEELMEHARRTIRLLIVVRSEIHPEYEETDAKEILDIDD